MNILTNLPPQDELGILGKEMIQWAFRDPCFIPQDGLDPRFYRRIGEDIQVSLMLELFELPHPNLPPPRWHASLSMLTEIGSGTDRTFGMPDQAVIATFQWSTAQRKQAEEILGCLFASIIIHTDQKIQYIFDDKPPAKGMRESFSLHWFIEALPETVGYGNSRKSLRSI